MARTSKKEAVEAEVQVSAQEEQIEETQQIQENEEQEASTQNAPENPVVVEKPAKEASVQAAAPKLVKIHAMESIDSIIAGKPYFLAKDRDHSVPSDVAAILVNGKKAYRI